MTRTKKLTFVKALAELKETRQLNTAMLAPFDLSFEVFLRYAQVSEDTQKEFIEKLIKHLDSKAAKV